MSTGTYTREQLRALPSEMRKKHIRQFVNMSYTGQVVEAAKSGNLSVLLQLPDYEQMRRGFAGHQIRAWESHPTTEDIREALLEFFPDCSITYEEKWVQTAPGKQELKKGLTVDWS